MELSKILAFAALVLAAVACALVFYLFQRVTDASIRFVLRIYPRKHILFSFIVAALFVVIVTVWQFGSAR